MLVHDFGRPPAAACARLTAYLCVQALMLADRRAGAGATVSTWEGEPAASRMLDALAMHGRAPR
jgi:hypothetical protein